MNIQQYKSIREENVACILGADADTKYPEILKIDTEEGFKATMTAAVLWINTRSTYFQYRNERFAYKGAQYSYHSSLVIIAFCAAELCRIG